MEDYRRVIAPPPLETLYAQELALDAAAIRRTFTNYLAQPARGGLFAREIAIESGVLRSAEYPRRRFVAIADAGHVPHIEQPDAFESALFAFLAAG